MSKKISIKKPKSTPEDADTWVSTRENTKRLTIDLPASLHTKLKINSAQTGRTMGELVKEFLKEKLGN